MSFNIINNNNPHIMSFNIINNNNSHIMSFNIINNNNPHIMPMTIIFTSCHLIISIKNKSSYHQINKWSPTLRHLILSIKIILTSCHLTLSTITITIILTLCYLILSITIILASCHLILSTIIILISTIKEITPNITSFNIINKNNSPYLWGKQKLFPPISSN